jgi:hypothetical protein
VTDQNANRISQQGVGAKPAAAKTATPAADAMVDAPGEPDPTKRTVRPVGPTFLPRH